MQWLVLAVITAAIVIIGAIMAYRQFSRAKQSKKAPFKKTYSTTLAKGLNTDIEPGRAEIEELAPTDLPSDHTASEKQQSDYSTAESVTETMPVDTETIVPEPSPTQTAHASVTVTEPSHSETAATQRAATITATKTEIEPMASKVSEAESASLQTGPTIPQRSQTGQFITEIESEPPPTAAQPPEQEREQTKSKPSASKATPKTSSEKTNSTQAKASSSKVKAETATADIQKDSNRTEPVKSKAQALTAAAPPSTADPAGPPTEPSKATVPENGAPSADTESENATDQPDTAPTIAENVAKTVKSKARADLKAPAISAEKENKPAIDSPPPAPAPGSNQDDQVAELIKSGKMEDWITLAKTPLSPQNLQALLHKITRTAYSRRKEARMRTIFVAHARKYVDTFKPIDAGDAVSAYIYKSLAIVLQENRKFDEALKICRRALDSGLDDGTKTGYPGRIERLERARKKNKK